ncbi:hypothetical protein [Burkholderia cenocepacia]|uniref:hypothetical protein n=1 Tax=Burkholderia cenocepacia TaxID=95486 RepID=UPI00339073AA
MKAAIVLIGINDINFAAMPPRAGLDCDYPHTQVTAASLIDGYRRLIEAAHRQGVKVFARHSRRRRCRPGARRTARGESVDPQRRRVRRRRGLRRGAARSGAPSVLQRRYDSGDGIHPSDAATRRWPTRCR